MLYTNANYILEGCDINIPKNSSKPKREKRKKPEKLEFVQNFIPIKDIKHGIIETTDGRFIKILEIEPINFTLRSSEEQFGII